MTTELGPWSRLIDQHRQNVDRLAVATPEAPGWWGLALGVLAPWVLFGAALLWRSAIYPVVGLGFVALVPTGLACLFVRRLQPFALGLLLGTGALLFVAKALYT